MESREFPYDSWGRSQWRAAVGVATFLATTQSLRRVTTSHLLPDRRSPSLSKEPIARAPPMIEAISRARAVRAPASNDLIALSPAMVEALYLADAFAPADRPVVLYGETGTGKSRLAKFIHNLSGRTGGFHAISVGTLAPSLAEE